MSGLGFRSCGLGRRALLRPTSSGVEFSDFSGRVRPIHATVALMLLHMASLGGLPPCTRGLVGAWDPNMIRYYAL